VDLLDEEELRFTIGHELGHALSGHAVYRTMLYHLTRLATRLAWFAIGYIGLRVIIAGLEEWYRKSELSCDRAGVLAGQGASAGADEAGRRCQDLRAEPRRVPAAGPRVRRSPRCPGRPHQAAAAPGQHAPVRRDAVRRAGPVGGGRGLRGDPWRRLPAPRGRLADLGDRGDEGRDEVLPGLVEPDLGPVRGAGQGLGGGRCRGGRAAVQRPVRPSGQRWLRGPGGLGRRLGLRGRLGLRLTARDGEAGRWRLRGPGLRAGLGSGRNWWPRG